MRKNLALIVAGCIFMIVAVAHLLRLFFGIEIMAANYVLPMTVSWVGFGVSLVLALWMFAASKSR